MTEIIGLDPSKALIDMARPRAQADGKAVSFLPASAEAIPLEAGSVDTVVTTWTMCSIPHPERALAEMRRVLKPGGDLLFVEHGRAPDPWVVRFQDWLTPAWRPLAGGCNLNRPIAELIAGAGSASWICAPGTRSEGRGRSRSCTKVSPASHETNRLYRVASDLASCAIS